MLSNGVKLFACIYNSIHGKEIHCFYIISALILCFILVSSLCYKLFGQTTNCQLVWYNSLFDFFRQAIRWWRICSQTSKMAPSFCPFWKSSVAKLWSVHSHHFWWPFLRSLRFMIILDTQNHWWLHWTFWMD